MSDSYGFIRPLTHSPIYPPIAHAINTIPTTHSLPLFHTEGSTGIGITIISARSWHHYFQCIDNRNCFIVIPYECPIELYRLKYISVCIFKYICKQHDYCLHFWYNCIQIDIIIKFMEKSNYKCLSSYNNHTHGIHHPGADSWEPECSLRNQGCEESIKSYWKRSNLNPIADFYADPDNVWRCCHWGKGFKVTRYLKGHITKVHPKRQWHGSTADRDTRHAVKVTAQAALPKVVCEGELLKNVWSFVYLVSKFSADGENMTDVKSRITIAMKTAGKLRNIWPSRWIPLLLKLRIYKTGVCSKLAYGSEAWTHGR